MKSKGKIISKKRKFNNGGSAKSEPKFKVGDTVKYTPKLSGFDNDTILTISAVRKRRHLQL